MSTLNVGTIASKTGNSSITIADNGNTTIGGDLTVNGTVTGGGGINLLETKTISSAVDEIIFSNKISATYNDYIVKGNYVNTTNHQLYVYLRDSSGDIGSGTVYQSAEAGRAGSTAYSGNGASSVQNFVYFPMVGNHYGGTVASFGMEFRNLHTGAVSGATSIAAHRMRNGTFNTQGQNVASSDWFFTQGGFTYLQTDTTAVPTVTGIKFKVAAGQFASGYISLYGVGK